MVFVLASQQEEVGTSSRDFEEHLMKELFSEVWARLKEAIGLSRHLRKSNGKALPSDLKWQRKAVLFREPSGAVAEESHQQLERRTS